MVIINIYTLFTILQKLWEEFIDFEEIQISERKSTRSYLALISRLCWVEPSKVVRSHSWNNTLYNRREEFLKRLNSYDIPVEPPPVPLFNQVLPIASSAMFTDLPSMHSILKPHFKALVEFAQ
jgi:hypothetical protein